MPGGNCNIRPEDCTNGFDKNPQNRGNGRKKKIYTILKEKGYQADDIKTAFGEMAFYTVKELNAVHNDESKPVITRIVANQFYLALSKGDWAKIREILEHTIGKPTQPILDETPPNRITSIKIIKSADNGNLPADSL
jgi:hypothetical protein